MVCGKGGIYGEAYISEVDRKPTSHDESTPMFNLFRRSRKVTQPQQPSSVLVCSFGDEPMIRDDDAIYREIGLEVFTEKFAGIEDFAEFMEGREIKIVHAFLRPDAEGKVPGLPAEDFFDCLLDSGTAILIVACENPVESTGAFTDVRRGWFDELTVVYTLDRKGENFKNFFSEVFSLMVRKGTNFPVAYVSIAPQNPNDPHEGCPSTLLVFGNRLVYSGLKD